MCLKILLLFSHYVHAWISRVFGCKITTQFPLITISDRVRSFWMEKVHSLWNVADPLDWLHNYVWISHGRDLNASVISCHVWMSHGIYWNASVVSCYVWMLKVQVTHKSSMHAMASEKPRMHASRQICLNASVVSCYVWMMKVTHNSRIRVRWDLKSRACMSHGRHIWMR